VQQWIAARAGDKKHRLLLLFIATSLGRERSSPLEVTCKSAAPSCRSWMDAWLSFTSQARCSGALLFMENEILKYLVIYVTKEV